MSSTRLMVLGVVRIFQPAHGYQIRRELLSWGVDKWANLNPGSIYNALRNLTREAYLAEVEDSDRRSGGQSRTVYRITPDGEQQFLGLLRQALWQVDQWDHTTLMAGLSFMHFLTRAEMIEAMDARAGALRASQAEIRHVMEMAVGNHSVPAQTVEHWNVYIERAGGELVWCQQFAERLRGGYYRFTPEPGWDAGPDRDGRWPGPLAPADSQS